MRQLLVMQIVRRETLTPDEAGMPFLRASGYAVLLYRLHCSRGCVGTYRYPAPREVLRDVQFLAELEQTVIDYGLAHACLRKAVAGRRVDA